MKARYYDPSLGRFSSEDPGRHGMNWFAYCDDNPVNRVDPDGKADSNLTDAFVALFVGIFLSRVFAGIFISAACCFLLPELALISVATCNLANVDGTIGILLMGIRAGFVMATNGLEDAWTRAGKGAGGAFGIVAEAVGCYAGYSGLITILSAEMDAVDNRIG